MTNQLHGHWGKSLETRPESEQGRALAIVVVAIAVVLAMAAAGAFWLSNRRRVPDHTTMAAATYVGEKRCAACHAAEAKAWSGSHHAQAMQTASDTTVLGDFNHARLVNQGVPFAFSKNSHQFFVNTDGADGKPHEYDLPYTFGVYPLQQYLAPFPGGRMQALMVAWDSRDREHGGQRWFGLYPGQKIGPGDQLHWTGRNATWNYMCAACHSTNLRPQYNLTNDSYATTWSDIDVACESCHGPGSRHVAWAESNKSGSYNEGEKSMGLVVDLRPPRGDWMGGDETGTRHWNGDPRLHTEIDTCAPCHSRRRPIASDAEPGQPFLDNYVPRLLDEGTYYPDGQIEAEDYEWGSFVQSRMYRNGVTCSDCHDPHTAKLRTTDLNQVCGKCHSLEKFASQEHTHHPAASAGALCVNCHMPTETYMVIDVRRDHSFRVPRPDWSQRFGTPNACNQCHKDRDSDWAANAVAQWYGPGRRQEPSFAVALVAGQRGSLDAQNKLTELVGDRSRPAIARATALTLLAPYLTSAGLATVQDALGDDDALVRAAAIGALEPLLPSEKVRLAAPLLNDPIRSVRIAAARLLIGIPADQLQASQKSALDRATQELIASEMVTAERPENHVNLALLYAQMGRPQEAESELQTALRLDPKYVPAMVNLADLDRAEQRDDEGGPWLEKAIAIEPNSAAAIHALGLLRIRQKRYAEALPLLAKAAKLDPANVRYSYVYAVALDSNGETEQAAQVLEQAHQRRPADREVLMALIQFESKKGNWPAAMMYGKQLAQLAPDDPNAQAILAALHSRQQ